MITRKFKCMLLSDLILSESSATQGTQRTLDYIPGSVFLGLVAGKIYAEIEKLGSNNKETGLLDAMNLFHAKKVRFGDAYPMYNNKRAIRIPASWHVIKGENYKTNVFVYHDFLEAQSIGNKLQTQTLKQCREGFVVKVDNHHFSVLEPEKNFAIKSAYDHDTRRSKDNQMYGYQSLEAGMDLCFQLDFDETVYQELGSKVLHYLVGKRNIGRSKTSQYGQINIEPFDFVDGFNEESFTGSDSTYLYAESRLVFLDHFGQPTVSPTSEQLGITGGTIDLLKSQIRTFRYAPFNFKRQSRDADRYGIEKGSVICINSIVSSEAKAKIKEGIGVYLNEGFGKVLINPEFLKSKKDTGEALWKWRQIDPESNQAAIQKITFGKAMENVVTNPLFLYLERIKNAEDEEQRSYSLVNTFAKEHKDLYQIKGEQFASQWGTIRMKAVQARNKEELWNSLFLKAETKKDSEAKGETSSPSKKTIIKKVIKEEGNTTKDGYLVSGIAASKWEGKRFNVFKEFFDKEETTVKMIINLSAEMAKICKRKGENHENS